MIVGEERETMRKREWSEEKETAMGEGKEIEKESQMNKKLNCVGFEMKNKKWDVRWVVKYIYIFIYILNLAMNAQIIWLLF